MNKSTKIALIIGGIVIVLPVLVTVLGYYYGSPGGYGFMGPGMMGGFGLMGGLMGIGMILFWGLIIWSIVVLVRGGVPGCHYSAQSDSALDVLKRRYARGEINKEEFEEKKRDMV